MLLDSFQPNASPSATCINLIYHSVMMVSGVCLGTNELIHFKCGKKKVCGK